MIRARFWERTVRRNASPSAASNPSVYIAGPIEFKLLDGYRKDFDGNIPTKLDDKDLSPDNTTAQNDIMPLNNNIDKIGLDPLGQGRPNRPDVYLYSLLVMAHVISFSGNTYTWNRVYQDMTVTVTKSSDGKQWNVATLNGSDPTKPPQQTPDCHNPPGWDKTNTLNTKNILYFYDNPGMTLAAPAITCNVNDYCYEETNFTYTLTVTAGTAQTTGTFNVGQTILAERECATGKYSSDWNGMLNTITPQSVPSCTINESKIRGIVGGTLPIVINHGAKH